MAPGTPRTSLSSARPAYLDFLLSDVPPVPPVPSLHSPTSSLGSVTSYMDSRSQAAPTPRTLSPAFDDFLDETRSVQSSRTQFVAPLLRLRTSTSRFFRRKGRSEVREGSTVSFSSSTGSLPSSSAASIRTATPRRPSLPKLNSFPFYPAKSMATPNYRPDQMSFPLQEPEEVATRRCYYFSARHCPGMVVGGRHGDACEKCLEAGFFGSP